MIRKLALILTVVASLSMWQACSEASAGEQTDVISQVSQALGSGNAAALAKFFPEQVGIAVLQKAPSYYSRKQAEQLVADFFRKNSPRKFEIAHSGGQTSAQYTVGNLSTSSGVYRVTFFLQGSGAAAMIQNLIIDRKED